MSFIFYLVKRHKKIQKVISKLKYHMEQLLDHKVIIKQKL